MFRKLTIVVAIVAFAAFFGVNATADGSGDDPAEPIGVNYVEAWGEGHLQVVGGAGLPMEAYSLQGMPVAVGTLQNQSEYIVVEASGGLHVRVGDDVFDLVADPDWMWE